MKKTYIAPKSICVNIEAEALIAESLGLNSTQKATSKTEALVKGDLFSVIDNSSDITSSNAWDDEEDW